MKPLIIVTGAHSYSQSGLLQNQLTQVYADGILFGGGLPLVATNVTAPDAAQLVMQADGLFVSGGTDVSPACYGEGKIEQCGEADPARDAMETLLIKAFAEARKPILGICRGLQIINVVFGGTLYQDISTQAGLHHPYDFMHKVVAAEGAVFAKLYGCEFTVNSLHHQAIRTLGKGLTATAVSKDDGIIEAFVHNELPILCTQWHPERMLGESRITGDGPDMTSYFEYFIDICR